ncbi:hypothetical protein AVEN_4536-1 [Araneus ventricosus]|uniref:Mos1 transposase HTH domain-containing protein n=1 Tax=Araneus ventricosus TaxID=182803 RepID=A0A4Y2BL81_ARAVE|nr:hypothetical protein AVEN_4536-1 [Araneus ventricosus]
MSERSEKLRYNLHFYFDKGTNSMQAHGEICAVYGQDTLSRTIVRRCFSLFRSINFDVQDAPLCGRPITEKVNAILPKAKHDRHVRCHDIVKGINIHHQTVLNHLKKAGWMPHELTQKYTGWNCYLRISTET